MSKDDLVKFLAQCVGGKKGKLSEEVKMAVVCFQETPPGMCSYFTISGRPQTVNENSDWAKNVVKACEDAAKEIGNTVCLNHSTDGVSCETKWNLEQILGCLSCVTNILSLSDTNHNAKCTVLI